MGGSHLQRETLHARGVTPSGSGHVVVSCALQTADGVSDPHRQYPPHASPHARIRRCISEFRHCFSALGMCGGPGRGSATLRAGSGGDSERGTHRPGSRIPSAPNTLTKPRSRTATNLIHYARRTSDSSQVRFNGVSRFARTRPIGSEPCRTPNPSPPQPHPTSDASPRPSLAPSR